MHHMDANYKYGEKAWRQLHKNATNNTEYVHHKIEAVQPPTTHHEQSPS